MKYLFKLTKDSIVKERLCMSTVEAVRFYADKLEEGEWTVESVIDGKGLDSRMKLFGRIRNRRKIGEKEERNP